MSQQSAHLNAIIEEIRASDAQKVKVAIADIDGVLRGKYIHKEKFLSVIDSGFGFCNVIFGWDCNDVCYDNVEYTGWHTGYPDALACIDVDTHRKIPWDEETSFFLADFVDEDGSPLGVCPRQVLKKIINRAQSAGFLPSFAIEYEWFNFEETPQSLAAKKHSSPQPITPGMFGYSILRSTYDQPYFATLFDELAAFNVPLEGLHTETGPGVFEAAIAKADALEAADRGVLFKTAVKEIAYRYGIMPSFMAKWDTTLPGCSGHIHQSLWDKDGNNLFYDENKNHKMSSLFESYLAGQITCLPQFLAFFAPTVNSYKRLVEGHWAPTRATWGVDNRTVALRVIPGSASSTRLETRASGADINPYIAIAAALASGLYGIEHKLQLTSDAVAGNGYEDTSAERFPASLNEATENLATSSAARDYFGDAFVDHFTNTRRFEWKQFQNAVTSWELERYFEII